MFAADLLEISVSGLPVELVLFLAGLSGILLSSLVSWRWARHLAARNALKFVITKIVA
jgi:hypothetical protein